MNKIVRQHYPVGKLPPELREGIDPSLKVTITIEAEAEAGDVVEPPLTLEQIFAHRLGPFRSRADIDLELSRQREDWNE